MKNESKNPEIDRTILLFAKLSPMTLMVLKGQLLTKKTNVSVKVIDIRAKERKF